MNLEDRASYLKCRNHPPERISLTHNCQRTKIRKKEKLFMMMSKSTLLLLYAFLMTIFLANHNGGLNYNDGISKKVAAAASNSLFFCEAFTLPTKTSITKAMRYSSYFSSELQKEQNNYNPSRLHLAGSLVGNNHQKRNIQYNIQSSNLSVSPPQQRPQEQISSSAAASSSLEQSEDTNGENNDPNDSSHQNNNNNSSNTSSPSTTTQNQYQQPKKYSSSYNNWIDQATRDILNQTRIPLSRLTTDDVESISGLMANWAKRKSESAALHVEALLKRVVDDINAGNTSVSVTTRMYTMAIDAWAKTGGKSAAERAHTIHASMVELYRTTGDVNIRPSTISYNAVINAWSKSNCDEAALRAEGILQEMLEEWKHAKCTDFECLDTDDDNVDDDKNNAGEEEDTKDEDALVNTGRNLGDAIKPDVVSFTSVIDTWAKSGHKDGAARAMNLLQRMEKLYEDEGQITMKPNVYTYSACINAFAKSSDPDAPKHAEKLLADMKESYKAGDSEVKPNVVNYNSVINAWGRCKLRGSAVRAAQILDLMYADGVEPDVLSYALVVSAWSHSSEPHATTEAERVLTEMEDWAMQKNDGIDKAFNEAVKSGQINNPSLPSIRIHLDVECYNTVLIALSKRQEPGAPARARKILQRMLKLADEGFETVRPNAKSWNSVLNAYSRSRDHDAAQRAEELLSEMCRQNIKPDVYSYAAILHAYQKHASPIAAQRADIIVRQMEQLYLDGEISSPPDVYHYTIVCACWARSGEKIASERCKQILDHMEERVEAGYFKCKPNVRTYNAVIDAYARGHHVDMAEAMLRNMIRQYNEGDFKVKPDGFTFNAVINAWTRSKRKGCGERAEKILEDLLRFHKDGNPDVRPDSRSFSHIIDFYSRSWAPDAAERAEWLLLGMIKMYSQGYQNVVPNIFCFSAVIGAFAKRNDPNGGLNAERILTYMEDLHQDYGIAKLAPNTFIMNAVLHAWSKSKDPMAGERAEQILLHMEQQYEEGKFEMKTNTRSYGLVLSCWAKSTNSAKASRAYKVLKKMQEVSKKNENVCQNVHCYNAIINAAAFSEGDFDERSHAFKVASMTFQELLESTTVDPISSSFGTYIKSCGKLSLPQRLVEPCIKKAFLECRDRGLVNDFVLTQVRYSTSKTHYKRLLKEVFQERSINERITMAEIPYSWRRNAIDRMNDDGRGEWHSEK